MEYSHRIGLAPVQTPNPTTKSTSKTFIPTNDPTDLLMKPRFIQTDPSLWGCVGTHTHRKKVTWRDVATPRKGLADVEATIVPPLPL